MGTANRAEAFLRQNNAQQQLAEAFARFRPSDDEIRRLQTVAALALSQPRPYIFAGVVQPDSAPVEDFALETAGGRAIALSDLRGRYGLIVFGYTFCPDVCPTTLTELNQALLALGPDSTDVQVLYVSVDPERDTPLRAQQYAQAFNPTFVGLSGSSDDIARVAGAYGVFYQGQAAPDSAAGYLMQHTASVLVIDRQGLLRTLWPFGASRDDIVSDLKSLLRQ